MLIVVDHDENHPLSWLTPPLVLPIASFFWIRSASSARSAGSLMVQFRIRDTNCREARRFPIRYGFKQAF
jgi:hypothetical protein